LLEDLVMICCFHGLDYKGAAPRVRARSVWANLIALGQAEVLLRGMNLLAKRIIWGVDLLSVGTVCCAGSVSTPPTGNLILSSVFPSEFPKMGLSGY
jgi:hypothetical protein